MMAFDGIEIAPNFEDVMLGVHLLNENEPDFKLKSTADRYHVGDGSLQESILEDKVFDECWRQDLECSRSPRAANNTKSMMYVLDPSDVEPYACDDVRLTRGLLELVRPALQHFNLYQIWKQINYYSYIICLMEHRGKVLSRSVLLHLVWGYEYAGETNTVDVYVRFLRSKIDPKLGRKLIETVRGVGYTIR
jgi:hypothetical protein